MEKKYYIASKYENGRHYDLYFDRDHKWEVSVDKDDPDYEEYQKPRYDTLAAAFLKDNLKVKNSRKLEEKKLIRRIAVKGIIVLLEGGLLIRVAVTNPKIQYIYHSFIEGRLYANENNLEYAQYVINHNETISSDVKEYLLSFFDEIMVSYKIVNIDAMIRMTDNIAKYDFSNVDLSDMDKTVLMLADIINSSYDISTRCLAQEFYEYYYNIQPSKKSLLFDALNGTSDSSLAIRIINGGNEEYYAYLSEKYGFSDSQIDDLHNFMILMQVGERSYDYDYYINQILAFYSREFNFLKPMEKYFDEQDLKNGIVTYNGNIFAENTVITVQKESQKYDVYCDKIAGFDITNWVYFDKFQDLMKNFDGNINRENSFDRLVVYLHTLLLFHNDGRFDADSDEYYYFYSLYSVGKVYLGENFYSYLSDGDIDYNNLTDVINNKILASYYFFKPLTEEELTLLAETLLCLQQEVRNGKLEFYDYEKCFGSIVETINLILGDEVSFNFKEMINQGVNNRNVSDLIKKFYDSKNAISLELTSN